MKVKNLLLIAILFKLRKFIILGVAAGAGALLYEVRQPSTPEVDEYGYVIEEASDAINNAGSEDSYDAIAGDGSLLATLKRARAEQQSNRYGVRNDSRQRSLFANRESAGSSTSGGIGTVGTIYSNNSRYNTAGVLKPTSMPKDDLALLQAAAKGDTKIVQERINAGVKIDSRDADRRTPLMYASANGFNSIIDRLLSAGAHPNFKDRSGHNAFDYAASRGLVEVVEYLLNRTHSPDDRHYIEYARTIRTAYAGDLAHMPPGEGKLKSINRINIEGQTPLHIVSGNGSTALIDEFIKRGANVNVINGFKQSPLHWAAWNNQPISTQALINAGAKINKPDASGNTPLMLAALSNSRDVVVLLVAQGANKYLMNKEGKTAAILAEDKGFKDLSKLLR